VQLNAREATPTAGRATAATSHQRGRRLHDRPVFDDLALPDGSRRKAKPERWEAAEGIVF
jgi:hypothetical protein